MNKRFIVIPIRQDIKDIFIQANRQCDYFVADDGTYSFNSMYFAVESLVEWGLGSESEVNDMFSNGDLILREI